MIERARAHDGRRGVARAARHCADAPLLAVLPGSRTSEIRFILPLFRDAVRRFAATKFRAWSRSCPPCRMSRPRARSGRRTGPTPLHIVESEDDKFAAFDAADVALAASGTVTAELALARTPMVVAYKRRRADLCAGATA